MSGAVRLEVLGDAGPADDFDLDLRWGELTSGDGVELYLPTGRDVPGETCDTHNPTCPDTCHATCPATCVNTCPDTCRNTCANTCRNTCGNTCRVTCANTCAHTCRDDFCQTNAQTHCFTCRSGCREP
ncbi:hypothetical protein [Modestobacter sp. DSM 44400]|uniref:hypothetical protein n=1 Tax=Modestobacter sp. DSM 44400 TaxID=1550230 RepID=UPI0011150858|nr:hypothetical protein [Modestobacter sp. DSM 44400]